MQIYILINMLSFAFNNGIPPFNMFIDALFIEFYSFRIKNLIQLFSKSLILSLTPKTDY